LTASPSTGPAAARRSPSTISWSQAARAFSENTPTRCRSSDAGKCTARRRIGDAGPQPCALASSGDDERGLGEFSISLATFCTTARVHPSAASTTPSWCRAAAAPETSTSDGPGHFLPSYERGPPRSTASTAISIPLTKLIPLTTRGVPSIRWSAATIREIINHGPAPRTPEYQHRWARAAGADADSPRRCPAAKDMIVVRVGDRHPSVEEIPHAKPRAARGRRLLALLLLPGRSRSVRTPASTITRAPARRAPASPKRIVRDRLRCRTQQRSVETIRRGHPRPETNPITREPRRASSKADKEIGPGRRGNGEPGESSDHQAGHQVSHGGHCNRRPTPALFVGFPVRSLASYESFRTSRGTRCSSSDQLGHRLGSGADLRARSPKLNAPDRRGVKYSGRASRFGPPDANSPDPAWSKLADIKASTASPPPSPATPSRQPARSPS